jgi:tetratricopeptide (TPR) repeat protein
MKTLALLILLACTPAALAVTDTQIDQLEALRLAGNYQAGLELGRGELASDPGNARLLYSLGELELETGGLDAAEQYFRSVIELAAQDAMMARLMLAEVHLQRGERQAAEQLWREIREAYQTREDLSTRDLQAIAGATRQLGKYDPQLFKEAVRLFDEVLRRDPANLQAGIALGELLLEKYNNQEALQVFEEVLARDDQHPRALLGLARSQHFDYSSAAVDSTLRALSINPNLVPARVLLARLFIELEQLDDARREAELALQVNPRSLEALATLAVIHRLQHDQDGFERIEARVLALNPGYAGLYTLLAEMAAQNRLYREAEQFANKAVELDPQSWQGYGLLGMNQMRLGKMQAGRANLERSFSGDPYNVWIKNTLQLADSFEDYVEVDQDAFRIVLHGDENALLEEYIHDLAQRAYRSFSARYRHQPRQPIRIELYPNHADFSVRSVGLAGVGLLGVSFGPVVAMDSPAARERGSFNWGSTLWHELAHVFHLTMTDNRVPRWFSEGLAVHEERTARQGWGGDVDPGFLQAYLEGRLLPVSQLNNGFVRPSYPEQVIHSYFQASLVFEFIESRWGFDTIREVLSSFRDSNSPETALLDGLQLDSATLDAAFDTYLRDKYSVALKALEPNADSAAEGNSSRLSPDTALPDKYFDQLKLGTLLLEQGKLELAEMFLLRAQQLFPEYAGGDSSYWLLAGLYLQQQKPAEAEQQLERMIAINAEHYEAHLQLARLRADRGAHAGAAAALEAAIFIYPYDLEVHRDLASHLAHLERWREAARERRAVLALDPVDRAEAHYQLAAAYDRAGDRSSAREQILYALEIAPNYFQAQALLLSLREAASADKPAD